MHREHMRIDAPFRLTLRSMQMMDIIMLALGLAFFALSVGYTIACDRL
jgi:SNF family Na+-dependent transporter